jgi:hypothetical protein
MLLKHKIILNSVLIFERIEIEEGMGKCTECKYSAFTANDCRSVEVRGHSLMHYCCSQYQDNILSKVKKSSSNYAYIIKW